MRVEPILGLAMSHGYGEAGLPALRMEAPDEGWLRGHGLGVRPLGDCMLIYRELDSAGRPRTILSEAATLNFALTSPGPEFVAVTDLAALRAAPAPLFTSVGLPPGEQVELALTHRRARGQETLIAGGAGPVRFLLGGRPHPAASIADLTATSTAGIVTVAGFAAGTRTVDLDGPGVVRGARITLDYPVQPHTPPDTLAEVEIVLEQSLIDARSSAGRQADYVIPFAARAVRWCFHVVVQNPVSADEVRLTVTAPPAEARGLAFGDAGRRDLTSAPDPGDPLGQALAARMPGRRLLRFLSDAPVPMRARPIRGIELSIGSTRLFGNLPNPQPTALAALRGPDGLGEFIQATIIADTV
jgi:hypothetical protein